MKNLISQEHVIYRTHLHWIIFLYPALWLFLFVFMYHAASYINVLLLYQLAIFVPLTLAFLDGTRTFVRYKTTEFTVTNKRLVIKEGFIRVITSEFFLQKLENIQTQQSILGKLLGYGTLIVHGTGGTSAVFYLMADPIKFCDQIQRQIDLKRLRD